MTTDVSSVDGKVILAVTVLMPSVIAVMSFATLPRTSLIRFLHQEHLATTEDLIQGIDAPTIRRTNHTPIMVPDTGDTKADHNPTPLNTVTKAATLEGIPCALLPATTAACTT